eukprot:930538-Prymnesium_polylepis.1
MRGNSQNPGGQASSKSRVAATRRVDVDEPVRVEEACRQDLKLSAPPAAGAAATRSLVDVRRKHCKPPRLPRWAGVVDAVRHQPQQPAARGRVAVEAQDGVVGRVAVDAVRVDKLRAVGACTRT